MARLPGYIVTTGEHRDGTGLTLTVRLRTWHPSFWSELWRMLDVQPRWMKPFVWVWAMTRLLRGSDD